MIEGATLAYMGHGADALREIDMAIRYNPLFPSLYLVHRARALFVSGKFEEALADVERAAIEMPAHANVLALLAACCEKLGHHEKAKLAVRELQDASPDYTLNFVQKTLPFAQDDHLKMFGELLSDAGLPR